MKEAREEFIKKMKGSIGKHTRKGRGLDPADSGMAEYDPEYSEILAEMDLQKELEKRIREILGEE